jgi:hypothetical protein
LIWRTNVINHFIEKHGYKTYLEIGVYNGTNLRNVIAEYKVGVDPAPNWSGEGVTDYKMTSDAFFRQNKESFDIIFIDGLHHADQVYKDVINSLAVLNKGGTIVCHDMNPEHEVYQMIPQQSDIWLGDCWKAWIRLRKELDYEMYVIDVDFGCGIIREGESKLLETSEELTYENLCAHRKVWLNLIKPKELLTLHCL